MIILIIIIFLVILLFVPLGIRIIYDDTYSDIDVFVFKLIRHKFDLDSFIRKFITDKNKISLKTILNNLELALNSKKIIKDICRSTKIEKSTIVLKEEFDNLFMFISFWNIISRYAYIIRKSFKKVNNEYYMISDGNKELSIEIIFKVNIIKVIFILIKNFKEVIKFIKIKRRQKKYGTSNLWFAKTI